MLCLLLLCTSQVFSLEATVTSEEQEQTLKETVTLSNGAEFPLLGLAMGELSKEDTSNVFAIPKSKDYKLIDTSHASDNESLIAKSLADPKTAHVLTKVGYTHLGYERTKLSVQNSLQNLDPVQKVHIMIHWPRCYPGVEWMDCEGAENALPENVKAAGPSPLLDPDNAWVGSWNALVELYKSEDRIVSIGVSNFELKDMEHLVTNSDIKPHVYQGNVATFLTDPNMIKIIQDNGIVFQAYGVMDRIYENMWNKPAAREYLSRIGLELTDFQPEGGAITAAQLILAWLFQNAFDVTAVVEPRKTVHIEENLNALLLPMFNKAQYKDMHEIIYSVLINDKDVVTNEEQQAHEDKDKIVLVINNKLVGKHIDMFWVNHESGERVPLNKHPIASGDTNSIKAVKGHLFEAQDENGKVYSFTVSGSEGPEGNEEFNILEEL